MIRIVETSDGSHTLFVPEINEHYHSIHGAIQESEHIFIRCGFKCYSKNPVRVFEAGFGTGLNAFLTCMASDEENRTVFYTAIDNYPLPDTITGILNYANFSGSGAGEIFRKIHAAKWNSAEKITENFVLHKIHADLTTTELNGVFDLVYFDAFGPDKQPGMWTEEIFRKIAAITVSGGILVTYSVKGTVRRALKASGFETELIPGPPGKRQITRAIKI